MQLKKQTKIDFHDWRFWYKFIGGLLMIAMILVAWIRGMVEIGQLKNDVVNWFNGPGIKSLPLDQFKDQLQKEFGLNPKIDWISIVPLTIEVDGIKKVDDLRVGAGFGGYTVETFSFFTILSNAAIAIWMLVAALKPKHEGVKGFVGYESTLIVTTTITVTMLIYMCMLLPVKISSGEPMDWLDWVIGMSEHLVFPLLIILYVCIVWKPNKTMTNREYMQQGWWKIIAIILAYGVYALVRGEMRYQGNEPYFTQYPYFFLYIHDPKVLGLPGYAWFIIAIVAIISICLGFSIGYNTIINKKMQKTDSATKKN